MSTLFHIAKPPMPEQQNQSGYSWPTPHCKRSLGPLNTWRGLCETNPQCSVHTTFQKNFLPFTLGKAATCDPVLCQGSVVGHSVSAQTPQGACCAHWGWQQLFNYSSCAAKGHEHERGAQEVPLPPYAHDFPSFADAQISLKSEQNRKVHLAENSF